jgi:hypothetical protein
MTLRHAFALVGAISLAAILAATDSAAAKSKSRAKPTQHFAPTASGTSVCHGGNLFRCGPVYNSTDYLGNDPDSFIRLMIQRDLGAKYGGET